MMTTTAALECQSNPNHMTRMGARPTMGRAATKLPIGKSPSCKNGLRSMATATTKAAATPMAKPDSAPLTTVCTKSAQRVGRAPAKVAAIAEGAGRITGLTPKPRT